VMLIRGLQGLAPIVSRMMEHQQTWQIRERFE